MNGGFRNNSPCAALVQRETGTLLAPLPPMAPGDGPNAGVSRLLSFGGALFI